MFCHAIHVPTILSDPTAAGVHLNHHACHDLLLVRFGNTVCDWRKTDRFLFVEIWSYYLSRLTDSRVPPRSLHVVDKTSGVLGLRSYNLGHCLRSCNLGHDLQVYQRTVRVPNKDIQC